MDYQDRLTNKRRLALWHECERQRQEDQEQRNQEAQVPGTSVGLLVLAALATIGAIGVMVGMILACFL